MRVSLGIEKGDNHDNQKLEENEQTRKKTIKKKSRKITGI